MNGKRVGLGMSMRDEAEGQAKLCITVFIILATCDLCRKRDKIIKYPSDAFKFNIKVPFNCIFHHLNGTGEISKK